MDRIVAGLQERPGLQLEIEGAIDAAVDGRALRRQKLEDELRLARWQSLGRSARAETVPEKIMFTPEEFTKFLEKRYQRDFSPEAIAARGGLTNVAAVPPSGTDVSRTTAKPSSATTPTVGASGPAKGAVALRGAPVERAPKVASQTMEDQVLSLVQLSETDYVRLATERTKAVRDYLLSSGKVTSERILMADLAGASSASKGSKVFLRLQ